MYKPLPSSVKSVPNLCDLCGLAVKRFPSLVFLGALVVDLPFTPATETRLPREDDRTALTSRFGVLRIFPLKRKEP
jgi:hypothetical protein